MAKAKNQTLMPEELLGQALVPENEQPYAVPRNWVWVNLVNGFSECLDNFRKPINADERATRDGDIPYYGATGQVGWIDDYLTDEHLVLIGEDGAPFFDYIKDKAYIIDGKAWVNNHAHILRSFYGVCGNLFMMHYLNVFNYKGYVNGTTRLKLTQSSMKSISIPLPPLDEQRRIVERIESLLEKLDHAKELAQNALDSFETRKAAILHKAFSGELTAHWRKENKITDEWENVNIEKFLTKSRKPMSTGPFGTMIKKHEHQLSGIPVLGIENIKDGDFQYGNKIFVTYEKAEHLSAFTLHEDDIIISRSGTVGELCLVPLDMDGSLLSTNLMRVTLDENIMIPRFFVFLFQSKGVVVEQVKELCRGSTRDFLNQTILKQISFPLPSLPEQQEIVRILDSLFEKEQRARELCDVIDKIDLMKKAILARAFRSELGTNDPSEESAMELLREVLSQQNPLNS